LAGCVTAAVFSVGWDALAVRMGWWSYPASGGLLSTMAVSITVAFLFGGAAGLAGWRMMRAMGWTGAITFFVAFVGVGLLRDHVLEINTNLFVIGPGLAPHIMGAVGYLSIALVVQITMLLMAGPPTRDSLRAGEEPGA
jgi:hypothetical protein